MSTLLLILFWSAAAALLYTWVLFPALVFLRAIFPRPCRSGDITPPVSVIIAAHNEEEHIGARLENVLALDYPPERLDVLVASDGSTDRTNAIAEAYAPHGVRLLALERGGKIATLNAAVAEARGDVLVFTDANTVFAPDALRNLVRPLADERVGGVAGNQVYLKQRDGKGSAEGERLFWDFDRWLKQAESRAGSTISATGALYAIRRSLFRPIPAGVTDDFVCSTQVIAQGFRLVFAADAIAYEPVAGSGAVEFGRKVRVITQGFRALVEMRALMNPLRYGFYAWQLFSHKLLRRLTVIPLGVLSLTAPLLWSEGAFYEVATGIEGLFYLAAGIGALLRNTRLGKLPLVSVPFYFVLVNAASLVAAFNVLRGRRIELWSPQREGGRGEAQPAAVVSAEGGRP